MLNGGMGLVKGLQIGGNLCAKPLLSSRSSDMGLVMEACASFCHEPSPKTGKFNQSGRITIWRGLWVGGAQQRMWMQCSPNCIRCTEGCRRGQLQRSKIVRKRAIEPLC